MVAGKLWRGLLRQLKDINEIYAAARPAPSPHMQARKCVCVGVYMLKDCCCQYLRVLYTHTYTYIFELSNWLAAGTCHTQPEPTLLHSFVLLQHVLGKQLTATALRGAEMKTKLNRNFTERVLMPLTAAATTSDTCAILLQAQLNQKEMHCALGIAPTTIVSVSLFATPGNLQFIFTVKSKKKYIYKGSEELDKQFYLPRSTLILNSRCQRQQSKSNRLLNKFFLFIKSVVKHVACPDIFWGLTENCLPIIYIV